MSDADAVFTERIWRMAETRMERQLREFRRTVFGDEHYLEELRQSDAIDRAMRRDPPPEPEVRKKLKPGWARKKMHWL